MVPPIRRRIIAVACVLALLGSGVGGAMAFQSTETKKSSHGSTLASVGAAQSADGAVEFINCTAVRITGDYEVARLETYYYAEDGFATSRYDVGPVNDTTVVDLSTGGEGVNGRSGIDGVTLYRNESDQPEPTVRKDSPYTESCDLRPEKPTFSVVERERTGDGTYRVTFEYTNPNDGVLAPPSRFVELDEPVEPPELEPGTHQVTVNWVPESANETLVWEIGLDGFGYENERVRVEQSGDGTTQEPRGSIEYLNCSAVRVTGDFEEVSVGTAYYTDGGAASNLGDYGPIDGTEVIDFSGSTEGFGEAISYVNARPADGQAVRKENPRMEECMKLVRPEKPSISVVEQHENGDGSYEVTFEYTNPNGEPVVTTARFEGRTDAEPPTELEPGTHRFTVTWTPRSADDELAWIVDMDAFGYENLRAESRPPGDSTDGSDGTSADGDPNAGGGSDDGAEENPGNANAGSDGSNADGDRPASSGSDGDSDAASGSGDGNSGASGSSDSSESNASSGSSSSDEGAADETTTDTEATTAVTTETTTADETADSSTTDAGTTDADPVTQIEGGAPAESPGQSGFGFAAGLLALLSMTGIAARRR